MAGFEGFNLDAFTSRFKNSYKPYLFYFTPRWPGIKSDVTPDDATYLVTSTTLPGVTVTSSDANWQGYKWPFGGKTELKQEWSTKFILDSNFSLYNTFVEYLKLIHDPETNIHGDPKEYMMQQQLYLLDHKNRGAVVTCTFLDMFPVSVSDIELSYSADGAIIDFDVSWKFSRHRYEKFRY